MPLLQLLSLFYKFITVHHKIIYEVTIRTITFQWFDRWSERNKKLFSMKTALFSKSQSINQTDPIFYMKLKGKFLVKYFHTAYSIFVNHSLYLFSKRVLSRCFTINSKSISFQLQKSKKHSIFIWEVYSNFSSNWIWNASQYL